MRDLQDGGFPFEKSDLTLQEWRDLGRVRRHFDGHRDREQLQAVSAEMMKLMMRAQRGGA
jgi:hypothetical protein